MSWAAWLLFLARIWVSAFCTPPRQVCSVLMLAPCKKACTLALDREELVEASWLSVDAIDATRRSRSVSVRVVAARVVVTRCRRVAKCDSAVRRAAASPRARVRAIDVSPDRRREDGETKQRGSQCNGKTAAGAAGCQPLAAAAVVQLEETDSSRAKDLFDRRRRAC